MVSKPFVTPSVESDGRRVSVSTRILNAVGAEHVRVPSDSKINMKKSSGRNGD
jgi:hypothetical protein